MKKHRKMSSIERGYAYTELRFRKRSGIEKVEEVTALVALGTILYRQGSDAIVDRRLGKVKGRNCANKSLFLLDNSLALRTRLQNFQDVVLKGATFASGGWT